MICKVYRLGNIEYQEAWDQQNRLALEIAAGEHPPALLLLEHDPVYTFGRQGQKENLLWDENELAQRGIRLHWSDSDWDERLRASALRRLKPWMWRRNLRASQGGTA